MINVLIDRVIEREGGYVNHPADRGGPTNMGVTMRTLAAWRRDESTDAQDVKNLELEEVRAIYLTNYWNKPGFHRLERSVVMEDMVFDSSIHHGPKQTVKFLQQAVNAEVDGLLGPQTLALLDTLPSVELAAAFMGQRVTFLGKIISGDKSQHVFAHGWFRRMQSFIRTIPMA